MSGYDRGRRDDFDRDRGGGRRDDYDRDRSSHRGDDRRGGGGYDDRRGGGGRDDRRGGGYGGGRGGGGRGGGGRGFGGRGGGRGRGRGGGGRGGMKRAPEVNVDELNFPGQRDVNLVKAQNEISYNPLGTRYSQLENSDVRRRIDEISGQADMDIPTMAPNQSISGRQIKLVKNEFKINILEDTKTLGLWRVDIQALTSGKFDKPLKKEDFRNIIHNVMKMLGCSIAFDGSELAVTHEDFNEFRNHQSVRIDHEDRTVVIRAECTSQKKPRDVEIRMKKVHELTWARLKEYINGETTQMPTDVIQVLDIILKAQVCKDVAFVKKGMMVPRGANIRMNDQNMQLTEGRQVWNGIHQSAHISSWKTEVGNVNHLTLNLDLSYTQVMQSTPISEQLLNAQHDGEIRNLEAAMMHLTFENTINGKFYKLAGFGRDQARNSQCQFDAKDRRRMNVLDYWDRQARDNGRSIQFRHGNLRPVKVKQGRNFIEIPAECCKLLPGQKPKTMSERHKGDMIRASAEPAPQRLDKIKAIVADKDMYGADELKKFGFEVDSKPMEAEGVVLNAPTLLDGKNTEIRVQNGEWKTKTFYKPYPKNLVWMMVYIRNEANRVDKRDYITTFKKSFISEGQKLGMKIEDPVDPRGNGELVAEIDDYEDFEKMSSALSKQGKDLSKLNFILICGGSSGDSASRDYQCIKLISESNIGCLTQFVRAKTVQAEIDSIQRGKGGEICHNLWLKLNEKMSGTNWKIDVPLPPTSKPLMVVGCSFSHAEADDDGARAKPTFVGFASTTLSGASGYVNSCYHQDPRLNIVCYPVLDKAFKHMIDSFGQANNGVLPEVIVWYRGGASTGAYQQILKNEMKTLRQLCANVRDGYCPQITFVVCIRNSHSKLFAKDAKDRVGDGQNVPAGTAVTGFGATPDSFHFHLCSHAGVGTVNPTFYQVLHDDNKLQLDNLVSMTYALTMDAKRCEKSISEPAPVRLASLRAERGLAHWSGALEIISSGRNRDAADHLRQDTNKMTTRSRFKKENFFI